MSKDRITIEQANEFYRDLCGTMYGDCNKTCQGTMTVELIAERMEMDLERAKDFCNAMIEYGITERQGGGIVV